jgi:NADPH:quinone reductase-like Zn-dependent oxidoreductase
VTVIDIDLVTSLGATAFDYTKKEEDVTGNRYDVIIDLVGGTERIEAFQKLKKGGHLVSTVGDLIRRVDSRGIIVGAFSAATELVAEKLVQGTALGVKYDWVYYKYEHAPSISHYKRSDGKALQQIAKLVDSKVIKPIVDPKQFSLLEMQAAHDYFETEKNVGKVVVSVKHD